MRISSSILIRRQHLTEEGPGHFPRKDFRGQELLRVQIPFSEVHLVSVIPKGYAQQRIFDEPEQKPCSVSPEHLNERVSMQTPFFPFLHCDHSPEELGVSVVIVDGWSFEIKVNPGQQVIPEGPRHFPGTDVPVQCSVRVQIPIFSEEHKPELKPPGYGQHFISAGPRHWDEMTGEEHL